MSVYVDESIHKYGRMIMCHMFTDSESMGELHDMARRIGIRRKWFQEHRKLPHYDVCKSKRELAIELGAIPCGREKVGEVMEKRRNSKGKGNGL